MSTQTPSALSLDRVSFDSLLKRRLFFTESFEVYRTASNFIGDNRGLYDYGPPGCGLQANIVDLWRKHFVLEEDMLEVDCTVLTPEDVFKTSGHVDKFADWMCKDSVKGEYLRADHLIESVLEERLRQDGGARADSQSTDGGHNQQSISSRRRENVGGIGPVTLQESVAAEYREILAQIDNLDGSAMADIITRFNIRNPDGDNEVSTPMPFNLMFMSSIGPSSAAPVYLRPETAQGQFLNFRKLLEYNQNSMPFASASIGKSYRNEISPRSGLLRVREFLMAEVEHFVDPHSGKRHTKFEDVAGDVLPLLDRDTQLAGKSDVKQMSIGEAVKSKMVDNETLGYFLARINAFLPLIGVDKHKLRFRQHLPNEMAHYACDCWDAELLTSYGWIECVGCADRSAYDLTVHMRRTREKLVVRETLKEPIKTLEWRAHFDKKSLGRGFKHDAKLVESAVNAMDQLSLKNLSKALTDAGEASIAVPGLSNGEANVTITREMLSIEYSTRVENVREYTPDVIEPSFGIGRILYSLLEHVFWCRPDDPARCVLSLPLAVAPTKVLLVPLSSGAALSQALKRISQRLRSLGISNRTDSSAASIGKRYARNDELGTPLSITVDFQTLKDGTITLRERDSTKQVRGSEDEIITSVKSMVDGYEVWERVAEKLPQFSISSED